MDLNALPLVRPADPPAPLPADKAAWRGAAQNVLRLRAEPQRKRHALKLANDVASLADQLRAQVVAIYAPLGAEVDTRDLANALLVRGVQLAYPRVRSDNSQMDMAESAGPSALVARPRSRMMEPAGPVVAPERIDLVVVPCLALHSGGYRLGRGGGYYDRWLPGLRADAVTVAAVAGACVWDFGPLEDHDQRLQLACTEAGLARCAR